MLPALLRRRPALRRCCPRSLSLRPLTSATTPRKRVAEGGDDEAAEDGAADPRGGVATDVARKVLEAVGGGAELDELRGILEEDAGG